MAFFCFVFYERNVLLLKKQKQNLIVVLKKMVNKLEVKEVKGKERGVRGCERSIGKKIDRTLKRITNLLN